MTSDNLNEDVTIDQEINEVFTELQSHLNNLKCSLLLLSSDNIEDYTKILELVDDIDNGSLEMTLLFKELKKLTTVLSKPETPEEKEALKQYKINKKNKKSKNVEEIKEIKEDNNLVV